jgi:S-DNA-T family DNA segregation ATPase FtsK/SpoIIIE
MTPVSKNRSKKESKTKQSSKGFGETPFLTSISKTLKRFLTYGWDFLGILLIFGALIIFLGYFEVTRGAIISPLAAFLQRWFGVGKYLLVISMAVLGYMAAHWRKSPPEKIPLGRILAFEFSFFFLLGMISIAMNHSYIEAQDEVFSGGLVGWGIAELFRLAVGSTAGFVLLAILFFLSLSTALRLFQRLEAFVRVEMQKMRFNRAESQQRNAILEPTIVRESAKKVNQNEEQDLQTAALPPEFQKSFTTIDLEDEKPDQPLVRSDQLPPLQLLSIGDTYKPDKRTINMTAGLIEKTLDEFGIPAKVVGFRTGPTVTQFAVEPGYIDKSDEERQKIRVAQILSLQRDLTLALSAERLRIEAPVPGKSYVGIEIPNPNSADVHLRPLLESEAFYRVNSPLALVLGRDVSGRPVVADLASMPHLLIAGTTGSGKSVCITALTSCLVMNNTPDDLKLAIIDPKRVELMRFNGLPHLMGNVETDIDRILGVLRWATTEMDYRYKLLEKARARNIDSYNRKMEQRNKQRLPKIVILIDELADLMISAPDETEHAIIRLAQKARAIGIHLIIATQRPSTDVVTGLIKANFPTRISFTVASSIDSRVILDTGGAETLLGKGDMLFLHPEIGLPMRAQGVIVTDKELNRVIKWWQKRPEPKSGSIQDRYDDSEQPPWEDIVGSEDQNDEDEDLIEEAIKLIKAEGHASASYFQRQLHVGYPRAARLVDQLEEMGIIGPSQGGGKEREILIDITQEDSSD